MAAAKPTVLVITGNSHTGEAAIFALRDKFAGQVRIRAVIRKQKHAERISTVPDLEVIVADLQQPSMLQSLFKGGVQAAYFAPPLGKNRVALGRVFIDLCIEHGVDYPVICSMVGADLSATEQPLREMAEIEAYARSKQGQPVKRQLWDTGKSLLQPIIMRSGVFYQNAFNHVAMIRAKVLYLPLGDDGRMPHTDLADLGAAIANVLVRPAKFGGRVYNVISEAQTGGQMASAINMGTSMGCRYEKVSDMVAVAAFKTAGLSADAAEQYVALLRFYRNGGGQDAVSDVTELTGARPRRFAEFCKTAIKPLLA